jgi:disulfide bond formation protein DsbB
VSFFGGSNQDGKPRVACRICKLIRVHVFLVVGVLALWRFNPEWFSWATDTDRYTVPGMILVALGGLFLYKLWDHYRG